MIGTFSHHAPSFEELTHQNWEVYTVSAAIFLGTNLLFIFIHSRYSSPKITPQSTPPLKGTITSPIPQEEAATEDEIIAAAAAYLERHKVSLRSSKAAEHEDLN